jgi:hypothetical protein
VVLFLGWRGPPSQLAPELAQGCLLIKGCDPDLPPTERQTQVVQPACDDCHGTWKLPEEIACSDLGTQRIHILNVEQGTRISQPLASPFQQACAAGNLEAIRHFFDQCFRSCGELRVEHQPEIAARELTGVVEGETIREEGLTCAGHALDRADDGGKPLRRFWKQVLLDLGQLALTPDENLGHSRMDS